MTPPVRLPVPRTLDRDKMTVEQVLAEAQMFKKTWRYREALRSYEEAIQREPGCIAALHGCASMLSMLDRPREALVVYEELLRLEPASAKALSRNGWALGRLKRYEEALLSYEEAICLQPENEHLAIAKAETLTEMKRHNEALSALDQALQLAPRKAAAYQKKGELLITLKRYEEALTPLQSAARFDAKNAVLREKIGDVYSELERYDEATKTYDRAERLAPHPLLAVHCMFGQASVRTRAEAQARLQAAGKEVTERAITAEIELMHKEKELEPLRSSLLFRPICQWMQEQQEWSGTPKQFKEILCQHFPDAFAAWYRSPRKYVEELEKIAPALHEEGIEVTVPPHTTLVTLTRATTAGHPSEDRSCQDLAQKGPVVTILCEEGVVKGNLLRQTKKRK